MANLAYSMILADTFRDLLGSVGVSLSRSNAMFAITAVVLLPLCLLKDLSSLAPFSLLGILGMGYTVVAMAVRYISGDYKLPDGKFVADMAENLQPKFGSTGAKGVFNPKAFILVSMLSTAYMSHFNAPKFYNELKDNTIERFNSVVYPSFAISILFFCTVAALGFLTFGANASGLILNNYSTGDTLMGLSRVAVALSLVFSYPLVFVGSREGVLDLLSVPKESRTDANLNALTVLLLSIVTALALKVEDLSFVLSFGGATLGNALIYVWPAIMFRGAVKRLGEEASDRMKVEVWVGMASAAIGTIMGFIGAKIALDGLSS